MTTIVVPGAVVSYTLAYGNIGNATALNAFLVDTVPAQTTFVAQASTPGWNCPDAAPAGTVCTFTLGNVLPNQEGAVIFALHFNTDVLPDVQILNVARIASQDGPLEPIVINNNSAALVVVQRPTNENPANEPNKPLPYRVFLPKISH